MSLKAGGVGINLTAASNAFVLVCLMESNHIADCFLIHALYLKVLLGQSFMSNPKVVWIIFYVLMASF